MSLTAGARLGPYEIVSPLGAGGMGEVYRAKDGRLNRTVAIKILSDESAVDAERRERFEREAKAISALDHPNICALYDVGEHEGTYFLVMPCLEGQTLDDRLSKGPLPPDQAIKYAIEIATALDAAHRRGIVHRDLKPGNVMLTKAGVKLLDFGLAKLKKEQGPMGNTTIATGTGIGTLLGTMPYMAPEQIEGREVDARSDIFALGAVIYEMVTGERAFKGATPASVIGAILKDEPAPMSTLQPLAPVMLDHVVTTCLAKDPEERWQSAADIARELKWTTAQSHNRSAAPTATAWRERSMWIALTALLGIALAFLAWRGIGPATRGGTIARLSVNPAPGTVFTAPATATVATPQFAVAPNGGSLAFVASSQELTSMLWLRSLDDLDARPLQGTEGAQEPFWSPDSQWIGFFDETGAMKKVAVSGGTVQSIARAIVDPRGASWGPDGSIIVGSGADGLYVSSADGGEPKPLTQLDRSHGEASHRWPQFLADGRHFVFTVRGDSTQKRGLYVGALDNARTFVYETDGDARFVEPGRLLFLDGDTLLSQSLDSSTFQLRSSTTAVASNVARSSRGNGAFSASNTGVIAYVGPSPQLSRLTWLDRRGSMVSTVGPSGDHDITDFRLSPDDTALAMSLVDPKTSVPDIWMADLVRGSVQRFTFGPRLHAAPQWSPDGTRVAYRTNTRGFTEIYIKSAGSGGAQVPMIDEATARKSGVGTLNMTATDWSKDGRYLATAAGAPTVDLWLFDVTGTKPPERIVSSPGDQLHGNFSPDGKFIAYTSNESRQQFEVYVETLPPSDRKWPISTNGGYEPRWRADGRELFYLARDGTLMAVPVSAGASPFGVPKPLFQTRVHTGVTMPRTHFVPNSDGSRFLVSVRTGDPAAVAITVMLNRTAEAR